jgi:hypothetical protein
MKDEAKTLDQIAAEVKQDLNDKVDLWMKSFSEKTGDLAKFPTIDQIEESLITLDAETQKIFLNMLSDCLSNVDEKDLIASKKANFPKRG